MSMDAGLRLQACQPVDVIDAFTVPLATLTPSQYAHNICLHPSKPLLAVAAGTSLAVYDLVTCTRISRLDMRGVISEMAFSPDGVMLVLVMQEWVIYGWSLATSRVHLLVPKRDKAEKVLDTCLLAVGGAGRASLFYCKYGKEAVRRATLTTGDVLDAKGRPARAKEGSWGAKMKLEPARPIMGLALPPLSSSLLVLHADGVMRAYNNSGPVTETFNPVFQVQVQEAVPKGLPPPGTLLIVPHPSSPSTTLIIQAARFGGGLNVLQLSAGASTPTLMARARIPGGAVVLGAGVLQDCQQLVAVVSSQPEGGRLRTLAWSLPDKVAESLAMPPVKVEPVELNPLLDPRASQQQQLLPTPLAPAPATNTTFSASYAAAPSGRYDAMLGVGSPTAGGGAGANRSDNAGGAVSAMLHGLWAPVPGWATSVSHGGVLAGGLAPVVSKVLVHPLLPVLAVQLQPSAYMKNTPAYMELTLAGASPDEYAQIRKLLSVPLITLTNWDCLLNAGAARAMLAPQHSTLQHWTPSAAITSATLTAAVSQNTPTKHSQPAKASPAITLAKPHLTLPGALYFVSDSALCKYSLSTKATTTLATLPEGATGGSQRVVHSLCFSKAGAWLVFFEQLGVPTGSNDRWQWSVIHASDTSAPVWLKPGKYGAFIGAREEQFAVVDASGRLAAVFSLATCKQAGAAPDYLYSLEGLSSGAGVALPVFPGPPRDPVPDPAASAVVGCVMWQSTAGGLAARPLPALLDPESTKAAAQNNPGYSTLGLPTATASRYVADTTTHDNSSSDGEYDTPGGTPKAGAGGGAAGEPLAEPQGTGAVAQGAALGPLGPKYWLPLQAGELALQVAWQSLAWEPAGGEGSAATGGTGRGKAGPAMAAVLTNQRVLLVTELLHLHAAVSLSEHTCSALPSPATSMLWAGPALLVTLADGRTIQVTWSGAVHPVCSVAGDSRAQLAGVTPDSLLLLRPVEGKKAGVASWEVVHRPLSMLQPLVLGWASLGLLASTSAGAAAAHACRAVMRSLLEHSDPSPVTPGLIWALLGTCALDLGYALASHNDGVDPSAYVAAAAAAGEWTAVERALGLELERAAHHPAPPPQGAASHCKLMAAAAGAVAHGQMHRAVSLLQMAGEWRLALAVAASSGDMNLVHGIAAQLTTSPGAHAMQGQAVAAQRLATAIRTLYGSSVTSVPDAKLQLVGPDGEPCAPEPGAWLLGAPRAAIKARVEVLDVDGLRAEPGEMVASAPVENLLVASLALDVATRTALSLRASTVSTDGGMTARHSAAGAGAVSGLPLAGSSKAHASEGALDMASTAPSGTGPGALDDIFGLDMMVTRTATGKDEFASMGTKSDIGSDSDSDLSAAPSPAQQWKGKVTIRDKATAPAAGGEQLRDAMRSLRLGPPGSTLTPSASMGGAAATANLGGSGLAMAGPSANFGGAAPFGTSSPSFQNLSPALAAGMAQMGQATGAPPAGAGGLQSFDSFPALQPIAPPQPGAGAWSTGGGATAAFQGVSPALAAGMAPQAGQQPQPQPMDFGFPGDSPWPNAAPAPQPPAPQAAPAPSTFQGLSPALAAGMAQPAPAPATAFQGLSPALAAGMTQQAPRAAAPPPASVQAAPSTPQTSYQGLSPALAAGMAQPPPAPAPSTFQGLSPALAAGMAQPAPAPATAFQGLSPALAAGMAPQAPAPAFQGLSPALAAGMATQPAPRAAPAPPASAFQGLSPALAAGMATQAPPAPSAFQGLSPALAAGMVGAATAAAAPPPAPPAAAAAPPAGNPDALYHEGVAFLESASWAAADERFSTALAIFKHQGEAQRSKAAFCAQYLAAVQLLSRAAVGAGEGEARLYRYAAALQLDTRHKVALTKEAIARNKQHRNFKYCGDALTWLITALAGSVPDTSLRPLQEAIDECERAGNRDASVSRGEDLEAFARVAGFCGARDDVVRLLEPILAAKNL